MTDPVLNCYYDGSDYVIAYSPEDASAAWREWASGTDHDDIESEWEVCDPDREFTCSLNETPPEGARTQTFAAWIAECGRGWFCTENY